MNSRVWMYHLTKKKGLVMKRYILKTVNADGSAYGNFQWPLEVGAEVVAPDWDPTPQCGGGLHGLLNGVGDGGLLNWDNDAVWIVAKVPKKAQLIDLGDKVKVSRCKVVFVGNQLSATSFLQENGCDGPIVGATVVAGNNGTATAGDCGTATAGYRGTIQIRWWDGNRSRTAVGYVGENGILPNVAYRVESGVFVEAQ